MLVWQNGLPPSERVSVPEKNAHVGFQPPPSGSPPPSANLPSDVVAVPVDRRLKMVALRCVPGSSVAVFVTHLSKVGTMLRYLLPAALHVLAAVPCPTAQIKGHSGRPGDH
ncbi:hypothetical protein N7474_009847 [Penicillium riverlandense]|uniref:uncharacterized protein n=1 Tax=Penicillium riverlandense TaxID=1903569 RepID=UPI002546B16E|nr:uncharacterized protein N7474_009847 [Penicillium riverlandense]KAJ5808578.1 hypothetical protein N7474_009847 [Penicillium riverlandense]